jgi:hypothetical protein
LHDDGPLSTWWPNDVPARSSDLSTTHRSRIKTHEGKPGCCLSKVLISDSRVIIGFVPYFVHERATFLAFVSIDGTYSLAKITSSHEFNMNQCRVPQRHLWCTNILSSCVLFVIICMHLYQSIQTLIVITVLEKVLGPISIGKLYHWIRGQTIIRLYVLIAIVEVFV